MLTFGSDPNSSEGVLSSNGTRDFLNDEYAAKVWPSILFLSVVMVTGSLGNLLVCVVYRFDLSKVNNRFILALTGIDLINCLTGVPGEIADLRYKYSFGDSSYCPAMRFFQAFSSLGSASILVAISVDRFQKICKPFGKQTTLRMSAAAIFVCVILSLFCASPAVVINGRRTGFVNGVSTADCSIADDFLGKSSAQIYNGFLFFLFTCACLILVVMYSLIWKKLRAQKTYRMKVSHGSESTAQLEKYQRSDASYHEGLATIREGAVYTADKNTVTVNTKNPSHGIRLSRVGQTIHSALTASRVTQDQDGNCNSNSNKKDKTLPVNEMSLSAKDTVKNCDTGGEDDNLHLNDAKRTGPSTSRKSALSDSPSNDVKSTPNHQPRSVEKTTIMMLLVTVAFILSFLPYLCLTTAQAVDRRRFQNLTSVQLAFYTLFLRSHFLNSALNPFIYSFFNLQFRAQLRKCIRRLRKCSIH